MPPLPLNIDAVPGEHPISLASRLAARNGAPLREFLSEMSIRAGLLLEGDPDQLASLADLAGQDPAKLSWNAPQPAGRSVRFRADQFAKSSFAARRSAAVSFV